ncbi:biotin-dependent carboxyltransferase family protein [Quadrisphaera sp. DSM 44207]|uniref:5-oxoprolinase subunit C family protein n=1 Tax=Quadrisphaera sp. DSM 44207 TaxID=1881057 RepID=UPI000891DD0D|nr:biotin-dependent carboxyltransferase family protein [Quadrisphaera sp. DSM 44207]SDQ86204.1 biotin-dependent carboxylase uncharacterized domain-containing protein [Quadrisphaera sp. DSM 44207]
MSAPAPTGARALHVLAPGPHAAVQDLGRPGRAALGVGASGAADRAALRRANRLLGDPEGTAAVETTLGGLRVRAEGDLLVAVTGAPVPVMVSGRGSVRTAGTEEVLRLRAGEELALGTPTSGLRGYVAVRGGIAVPPVLGSRSTDVLAGLGPPLLAAGTVLPVGPAPAAPPVLDALPVPAPPAGDLVLRVVLGPRDDWFTPEAVRALLGAAWTVGPASDRVGMRLLGPALARTRAQELPSEGLVRGALQVAAGGAPTLMLADHPVTGGYPVIAVVLDADTDAAAQARPGQRLRFTRAAGSSPARSAGTARASPTPR